LYVVRSPRREALQKELESRGVQTVVHYPIALPNLKAYSSMGHKPQDFAVSSQFQGEVLSLPMFPEISAEEQSYVAKSVREALTAISSARS
jgi:dTDP-4-amino-4,6-dideoxygalactose transaminase